MIEDALDESFVYCKFNETKNNSSTSKYCSLKLELEEVNSGLKKDFDSSGNVRYYMFGAFVIIASSMIAGVVYMTTKRRELLAFSAQQVMPVAKEGIKEMAPVVGEVAKDVAKQVMPIVKENLEEMASTMGKVAKNISKGIKEGLKDEEK